MEQESVVILPVIGFDSAEDKLGRRRSPPDSLCSPALQEPEVKICESLGRDQFKPNRKHLKIKSALMAERLACKPAPEAPCAGWTSHFGAGRLGAAAKKPVSDLGQFQASFETLLFSISPRSPVSRRLKPLSWWQMFRPQMRNVELWRNGQAY
jgi:hypothetical protein